MNIQAIIDSLRGCPCGQEHTADLRNVEIGSGIIRDTAKILADASFPRKLLVVADKNTLAASDGIIDILQSGGFDCVLRLFDDLRVAEMDEVDRIAALSAPCEGILAVGTGSLSDICRLAALKADKQFAIFATAPSMDGFASGTSPITAHNFKVTYPARQPSVVIADTKILAASPAELRSAGFGDMIGKIIGLVDWKVSNLLTGEHYCDAIANLTRTAVDRLCALADRITSSDEETAGLVMESLVFTGIAMKLADSVRPASGTEHIISHFWEIKKLEQGLLSDFHGKKVGVATVISNRIYHWLAERETITPTPDVIDWETLERVYGPNFIGDVRRLNNPVITDKTSPELIGKYWEELRSIVKKDLPTDEQLVSLMKRAGAATTLDDISVSRELGVKGVRWHPYMRYRMTLMRIIPMLGIASEEIDAKVEEFTV
ncbi:MAG: sn-glycerol-1-phosphate dehydrogenase [Clostridiales bacterium]|nr:sn-glycerol-1-phosphate dehydrogenase [Clostridiales bacterium]